MLDFTVFGRAKPKLPGHYWYRNKFGQDFVVRVCLHRPTNTLEVFISGEWVAVTRAKGKFAKAPIPATVRKV